jgi:hypothetical protein
MKKLSIAFIVALVFAGISFADSNTVASANVLGYTKVTDPASNKMTVVAAPFNCGTGTVMTLQDIFGTNQLRQGILPGRCDQVFVWDFSQQKYAQYVQKTNGMFYYYTNFGGSAVSPVITKGQAMWVKAPVTTYSPTEKTVIISGNVPVDGAYTNPIIGNSGAPLSFIANPYPVEMDINDLISTNDGAKGHFLPTKADRIMLWDNASQQYLNLALKTPTNKWFFYTNFSASSAPVFKIKPGHGFWYKTTNSFTWIESKTYVLE